ncbi:MAG: phr [Planctomycetota bacterium]|nr:phr [Planctomycetota bacterium]
MQRAKRGRDNPALNLAISVGNALKKPVIVVFGLTANYPGAQRRHYRFLVDGLPEVQDALAARNVHLVLRIGDPADVVLCVAEEVRPALVIADENPLRIGMEWRRLVAEGLSVPFVLVDADVVVPSAHFPKEEFAARTIRPKIHKVLDLYMQRTGNPRAHIALPPAEIPVGEGIEPDALLNSLHVGGVGEVADYRGGPAEAMRRLQRFLKDRLPRYATERNEPTPYMTSELSAHLHFGHISPTTIALAVRDSGAAQESIDAFLEELIVRRELAINFVARNPDYDRLEGCAAWGLKTLAKHRDDPRPVLYSAETLERGETSDLLWNAAQKEMVLTGRMHNYLRMYWAKKILEWSPDPETAFAIALDLNDRYEMDGRDPNGYAGIAWAIGGKHDRPWAERQIFGTIRFMSGASTGRKFDSAAYISRVQELEKGTYLAT